MGNTNYYGILGYAHVRGNRSDGPTSKDPLLGQLLHVTAQSTDPEPNTVIHGVTSGARARVVLVGQDSGGASKHEVLLMPTGLGALPRAFQSGESLTYDSGGTATAGNTVVATFADQGIFSAADASFDGQQLSGMLDITLNTPVPNDGTSDYPWWDPTAKLAMEVPVTGVTGTYAIGDRYTTTGGADFTVLKATDNGGGSWSLLVIRVTNGPLTATDTVTAVTAGATGDGTLGTIPSEPDVGMWLPWYPYPNWNGLADAFEFPPMCEATDRGTASLGPGRTFVRDVYDHHQLEEDPNDQNCRVVVGDLNDFDPDGEFNIGGVTIQVLKFAAVDAGWQLYEDVTIASTGFSATIVGLTATKMLIKSFNGIAVKVGDTLVGGTSATSVAAESPVYGCRKGCHNYDEWLAEMSIAYTRDNALFGAQARLWQGIALWVWESEISVYADVVFGSVTDIEMRTAWIELFSELRADLGNSELPIAIVKPPITYQGLGVPGIAFVLGEVIEQIENLDGNVSIVSPAGWEHGHSSQTLETASLGTSVVTWMRTTDYLEAGSRIWRALRFAQYVPPVGSMLPLPIILSAGQSQGVSFLGANSFAVDSDLDPDLYSSATFPGVSTLDPLVFMWNAKSTNETWEPFDVLVNGNTFKLELQDGAENTFSGLHCALALRMKKRFGEGGESTEVGMVHLNISGSAVSGKSHYATACWDPLAGTQEERDIDNVTVTPLVGPTRGRFTGAAGSFTGWQTLDKVLVSGSALGVIGAGGNNHPDDAPTGILNIASDGSWIDVDGAFVAEGPITFTFKRGSPRIWAEARDSIRAALQKCVTELNRIPRLKAFVWWQGQSDMGYADALAEHETVLNRVLDEFHKEFGSGQVKGETPAATVIMRVGANTPLGTDEQLATLRAAQASVASSRTNTSLVDTDTLPLRSKGIWPRTTRQDNDAHLTLRGSVMGGYLADEALGNLTGIPDHPDGAAAVDFGTDGGSGSTDTDGADDAVDSGDASTDGDSSAASISASEAGSIIDALDQAVLDGGDVSQYTVNGRTVTMRSLTELIQTRKYYEAQKARAKGVRYTKARFN